MTTTASRRVRISTATLATGLLLAVVPGVVSGTAAHADVATSMTLAANRTSLVAGDRIELLAHLNVKHAPVTITEAYRGQTAHTIYQGTTDDNGNLATVGTVAYSAVYTATFAGGNGFMASNAQVGTTVRTVMVIRASGGAKRHGYRLYRQSKKATVATAVAPSKTGRRVLFRLQVLRGHHYRTVDTRRYSLRKGSGVKVTYRGKAGRRYRVRAEYAGDTLNAGNHSAWVYSRFRR